MESLSVDSRQIGLSLNLDLFTFTRVFAKRRFRAHHSQKLKDGPRKQQTTQRPSGAAERRPQAANHPRSSRHVLVLIQTLTSQY